MPFFLDMSKTGFRVHPLEVAFVKLKKHKNNIKLTCISLKTYNHYSFILTLKYNSCFSEIKPEVINLNDVCGGQNATSGRRTRNPMLVPI